MKPAVTFALISAFDSPKGLLNFFKTSKKMTEAISQNETPDNVHYRPFVTYPSQMCTNSYEFFLSSAKNYEFHTKFHV